MTKDTLLHDVATDKALTIIQQIQAPRPVSVADDERARELFGFGHKRTTYTAIGVPVVELPNGRFAVLVADVERALRERGATRPRRRASDELDLDKAVATAGLRIVSRGGHR